MIAEVAVTLWEVHGMRPLRNRFSAWDVVDVYARTAAERGGGGIPRAPDGHRLGMSEQETGRGAAEERAGIPDTEAEHEGPASPSSLPGNESSRVDGAAEEAAGVDEEQP